MNEIKSKEVKFKILGFFYIIKVNNICWFFLGLLIGGKFKYVYLWICVVRNIFFVGVLVVIVGVVVLIYLIGYGINKVYVCYLLVV